ncbi:MAG: fimbria/pilus outer membrane usher protein [Methylobacter sp.]
MVGITGHAKPGNSNGPQTLLLDVTINTQKLAGIIRIEKLTDGRLVLPVDAWLEARLRPSGEKLTLPDGSRGYALDAVPGLHYTLNNGMLALDITAPAEAFEARALDRGRGGEAPPNPAPPGAYLNYNLVGTQSSDSGISYGAFLEGVAFNGWGSLVFSGVARGNDNQHELIRTDTYWQKDLPGPMETLVLGDTVGSGGAWSRPARFGGIRWARNFSLRPGYIAFPMPSLSGSAALPSTIDVLVNNQLRQSQTVEPGPFAITNVPVVTGAGEVNLVVRDILGVESLVSQNYYTSPSLLAAGLSDFSFEAGSLRENYGSQSNDYGAAFAAGTWRQGLSNAHTGEARLELQQHRQAAGIELAGLLGNFAVARVAASYARAEVEQGGSYIVGLERRAANLGGGSLQWQYFDRSYTQFGALPNEIRPRDRFTAGFGMPLALGASAGVSYISQSSWNSDRFQLATANLNLSLPWDMYLSAYASRQLDENKGWSGGLNITVPLGTLRSASASSIRDADGHITNALQASQSAYQGLGLGWHLRTSDDPNQQLQGGSTLNTNYGQLAADANLGKDGTALRLGANGSIGWLQGLPFATRNIGHDSFAVVKVGDVNDLPVYRSNQIIATTNSSGLALVPNLLPYQKNNITIEPGELPLDVEFKSVKEMPVPYARSGIFVEFPVRRTRNALVVLHQPNGTPVPAGARVTASPSGQTFIVAKRGQVYLRDLTTDNRIVVQWQNGRCDLAVPLTADGPAEPRIGPLTCGDPR